MVFIFCDVSKLLSFSEEKSIINNADKNTLTIFTVYIHFVLLLDSVLEKLMLALSFITTPDPRTALFLGGQKQSANRGSTV